MVMLMKMKMRQIAIVLIILSFLCIACNNGSITADPTPSASEFPSTSLATPSFFSESVEDSAFELKCFPDIQKAYVECDIQRGYRPDEGEEYPAIYYESLEDYMETISTGAFTTEQIEALSVYFASYQEMVSGFPVHHHLRRKQYPVVPPSFLETYRPVLPEGFELSSVYSGRHGAVTVEYQSKEDESIKLLYTMSLPWTDTSVDFTPFIETIDEKPSYSSRKVEEDRDGVRVVRYTPTLITSTMYELCSTIVEFYDDVTVRTVIDRRGYKTVRAVWKNEVGMDVYMELKYGQSEKPSQALVFTVFEGVALTYTLDPDWILENAESLSLSSFGFAFIGD